MLKVIESKPPLDYAAAYARTIRRTAQRIADDGRQPTELETMSAAYCQVKIILSVGKEAATMEDYQDCLLNLASLTPRQLVTTFPPEKRYDGHRFQCKDYFFTMEAVNSLPLDEPIGEAIHDLLWDYDNGDTKILYVSALTCADNMRKAETGKSFMEEWLEEKGVNAYHEYKDHTTGQRFMVDRDGKSFPVWMPVPRGWGIVEGDA